MDAEVDVPVRVSGRAWLILALVCGSFGIGVSEFVVMGLLPQIAADLLPELYMEDADSAVALTGRVVSFYALGVVAGMVVIPLVLRRLTFRASAMICAAMMSACTLTTSIATTLELVVLLRFFSSLTHASYVGLAAILVGRMLGAGYQGRGASLIMGGFAIANLLGVPVGTLLGAGGDWRMVLAFCSLLFLVPVTALLFVPGLSTGSTTLPGSADLAGGSNTRVAVLIVVGIAIATGGFTLITFVAPTVGWLQEEASVAIPIAVFMLLFGVGMNIGNFGGGWLTDSSADLALLLSGVSGMVGAVLLCIPAESGMTAIIGMLLIGMAVGTYSPAAQVLFVSTATRWPKLAASLVSGTTNLGSFIGASAGGLVLSGLGPPMVPQFALVLLSIGALTQVIRMVGR